MTPTGNAEPDAAAKGTLAFVTVFAFRTAGISISGEGGVHKLRLSANNRLESSLTSVSAVPVTVSACRSSRNDLLALLVTRAVGSAVCRWPTSLLVICDNMSSERILEVNHGMASRTRQ